MTDDPDLGPALGLDLPATTPAYQVLARKYRPQTFADLVGQEAMVRTLTNAFAADRIAQAFILTGIRGTGKTTTARIIAKGLNCIGPDGQGGPTTTPCGLCEPCRSIADSRHVDVLEMDAASRTGVNDIREIIDSVHYRATSARFKVYIIDEVHMLSTSAFNALLKTLEEPPPHVKFIFATTEIRKVPVTVLSRCQRFDLRRIEPEVMLGLLRRIAAAEGAVLTDAALGLITRAAEGSARDATSLLDQAISHGDGAEVGADLVRAMLGLADRGRVLDLMEMVLRGDAAQALAEVRAQYDDGADPVVVLRDLAEVTHWLSVLKIAPATGDDPTLGPDERLRGTDLAGRVPMRVLTRLWQMLLKTLEEVAVAPHAIMAAEMAVIRLTHVADLPDPEALIRRVQAAQAAGEFSRPSAPEGGGGTRARAGGGAEAVARQPMPEAAVAGPLAALSDWPAVLAKLGELKDLKLLIDVENHVRLVRYAPGMIEFSPAAGAPGDLASRLSERLRGATGVRWTVALAPEGGAPTVAETRSAQQAEADAEVLSSPLMSEVLRHFPGARLVAVTARAVDPEPAGGQIATDSVGPVEAVEEWDPFEEG